MFEYLSNVLVEKQFEYEKENEKLAEIREKINALLELNEIKPQLDLYNLSKVPVLGYIVVACFAISPKEYIKNNLKPKSKNEPTEIENKISKYIKIIDEIISDEEKNKSNKISRKKLNKAIEILITEVEKLEYKHQNLKHSISVINYLLENFSYYQMTYDVVSNNKDLKEEYKNDELYNIFDIHYELYKNNTKENSLEEKINYSSVNLSKYESKQDPKKYIIML